MNGHVRAMIDNERPMLKSHIHASPPSNAGSIAPLRDCVNAQAAVAGDQAISVLTMRMPKPSSPT
jgi:hypothetical protein